MASNEAALLYNLEGEKARKLKLIFIQNGIRIKQVAKEDYLQSIGALAGIRELKREAPSYEGDGFQEEMLVMRGIYGKRLDLLLAQMRKMKVSVALKAVLTEQNILWSSLELYEEIRKEHEQMTGVGMED